MTMDYKSLPVTPEEEEAWQELERYLSGLHDRQAYLESRKPSVWEALTLNEPWEY